MTFCHMFPFHCPFSDVPLERPLSIQSSLAESLLKKTNLAN